MKPTKVALLGSCLSVLFLAAPASAEIVCNRAGDCWYVRERHNYRPEFGLTIHPDNWKWAEREHERYRWREHEGRGYWHEGVWIEF